MELFSKYNRICIAIIMVFATTFPVCGQGDIVLKFRHKNCPVFTRKLNLYLINQALIIETQDTVILFSGGFLMLSDDLFIKQTRYDSIAIPLEDIRSLYKSKEEIGAMGGVMLTISAVVVGIQAVTGTFNEEGDLKQAWTPYIALAAGSGALIAIGAIRSNYNLRRWKLVAIEDMRTPWPNGQIPP
jgi:hypothetical protein